MASELKVDKFTGVTTAGSILVTGEGNSTTTNLQQGLGKVFINFNGTGTIATRDSFNTSSIADVGTGNYRVVFSNNMGNVNYTNVLNCNSTATLNGMYGSTDTGTGLTTTSQLEFFTCSAATTNTDATTVQMTTFGDLA
jgi:hypothetical protein